MSLELGRDIASVWLALLCFVGLLVPLVAGYFAVRGMNFAHRKTAELLEQTQSLSAKARLQTEQTAAQVRAPVARLRANEARLEQTVQSLLPTNRKSTGQSNR